MYVNVCVYVRIDIPEKIDKVHGSGGDEISRCSVCLFGGPLMTL